MNKNQSRSDAPKKPRERMGESRTQTSVGKIQELRKKMLARTKAGVKKAYESKDVLVIQAISALDELSAIINTMMMRLREWYSVYFPELSRQVKEHDSYVEVVLALESKDKSRVDSYTGPQAEKVKKLASTSMGSDMTSDELKSVKEYARVITSLFEEEKRLEKDLENFMSSIAPNLKAVAGPKLGAKLISHAGSLEKLAMLPSSTIQIMGAEKALFKHLKSGARPPKHGLIFQHNLISGAKKDVRGKLSRLVAAKLSIAAREDYFSKGQKDISKDLMQDLNAKVNELQK